MKFKKPKFWDYKKISIWSILLFPISIIFLFASLIVRIFKSLLLRKNYKIPIICVGNIYVGGTGKTPLASEVFKLIKLIGKNPAFIKKDYDYLFDEIQMLKKIGPTFLGGNRGVAINNLIMKGHDVAILDDGYQDFSIKPDFSILCFHSNQLLGNGFLIPSGPLRERLGSILRAECIVINGFKNLDFENKVNNYLGGKKLPIFYSKYKIKNIEKLKNKEITAFAGIGNPSNFFKLLKENGLNLRKTYSFPDHHYYSQKDIDKITKNNPSKIVTTEKDYCRMDDKQRQNCECVEIDLEIENKTEFESLIKSYL
tara:strand:- start:584 stop:1519 length:936 start_codon:yes stop_codon:yes gene_type:complete